MTKWADVGLPGGGGEVGGFVEREGAKDRTRLRGRSPLLTSLSVNMWKTDERLEFSGSWEDSQTIIIDSQVTEVRLPRKGPPLVEPLTLSPSAIARFYEQKKTRSFWSVRHTAGSLTLKFSARGEY